MAERMTGDIQGADSRRDEDAAERLAATAAQVRAAAAALLRESGFDGAISLELRQQVLGSPATYRLSLSAVLRDRGGSR